MVCILALVIVTVFSGSVFADRNVLADGIRPQSSDQNISGEEAKTIVLRHSKITDADAAYLNPAIPGTQQACIFTSKSDTKASGRT